MRGWSLVCILALIAAGCVSTPAPEQPYADTDGDGLSDADEAELGSNPYDGDSDDDGVEDGVEESTDGDATDPQVVPFDEDDDGLPDSWERRHFGNLEAGPSNDPDGDGLDNLGEVKHRTNPHEADTDGDGVSDGKEVQAKTDPLDPAEFPETEFNVVVERVQIVDNGDGMGEPSIGVDPEGNLFTNIGSKIYRSSDQGTTWSFVNWPGYLGNWDPDLAVDVDGNLWESHLFALACNEVGVSRDGGTTWWSHPFVCNLVGGDRQYIIPTTGGEAYLVWHQIPTFDMTVMKTTDYAVTWTPTGPGEGTQMQFSGWGGGGFWNQETGSTFFTYMRAPGSVSVLGGAFDAPGFSVTRDGFNWVSGQGPKLTGQPQGLALVTGAADEAGNVYLTWMEDFDGDSAVYVSRSTDDGRTWEEKVRVDATVSGKVFPTVIAHGDGQIAVAYYESKAVGSPDNNDGPWYPTIAWTSDYASRQFDQLALTPQPVKESPICTSGSGCSGNREFLDYLDAQFMPDGSAAIVFNSIAGGGLRNYVAVTSPLYQE